MSFHDTTAHVYGQVSATYSASGLGSPLPIPSGRKAPPPVGYTGRGGERPSYERLGEWTSFRPYWNVAIRLAPGIVGIDVDAHGDRDGAAALERIVNRHGPLPVTFISTARGCDDVSGIRWLRLPVGVEECDLHERWAGDGIDIIRASHRYALVWPSVHPNGNTYRWYVKGIEEPLPTSDELPTLPDGWVLHLTGRCRCFDKPTLAGVEWLALHTSKANRPRRLRATSLFSEASMKTGAAKILDRRSISLAGVSPGNRNNEAYRTAFHLFGRLALNERSVSIEDIHRSLMAACQANGLVKDSGWHAVDATLHSAFSDAERAHREGEFDA